MNIKILYYLQLSLVKALKIVGAVALTAVGAFFVVIWNMRTQPINTTPYMQQVQKETKVKPKQRWTPLDSIAPDVIKAVIACEDNNFFYHFGFDIDAIKEAMQRNQSGKRVYGASTITQQMVKNVFLSHERTYMRKAAELAMSVVVEKIWGKERIMEVYLNVIETGKNVYGIEAAAQHYFHKRAYKLTREEAVLIAISLPNPKKFNPAKPTPYMQRRKADILVMMDKLMKYGWYKNVTDIKQIKVNYLDAYPSAPPKAATTAARDTTDADDSTDDENDVTR